MQGTLTVVSVLTALCSFAGCLPLRYHFIHAALPWSEAQTYCRQQFADLATVFNIEDKNRMVNTAQDASGGFVGKAWIGLHDDLDSWRWSFSDGRYYGDGERDYRNWDSGQPDNFQGDQMCVRMLSGGRWDDVSCFLKSPSVCYDGTNGTSQHFIIVEEEMNWFDAQLYCRSSFTDLASVREEKENQEIQRLAQKRNVWIGLNRTRQWSDHSDSTFRYWKQGQPDNRGLRQNCTASDLSNAGLWSDESCSKELSFICYGENDQTLTPNIRTTTQTEPTSDLSTLITSSEQPSTTEVDQTRTISYQTLQKPSNSTTLTPNTRTTTQTESTSDLSTLISTTEVPEETTSQPVLSTSEGDSTSSGVSPRPYPTPTVDQTGIHVINLNVKFSSSIQLSEDDIRELVSGQVHNLLLELGLPSSIKVSLRTLQKP